MSPPSQSHGEVNVSPVPSSATATVTIDTHHDKNQEQEEIRSGGNHSPITVATQQHQQLFSTSQSSTFTAFSDYTATTTATSNISNSSTSPTITTATISSKSSHTSPSIEAATTNLHQSHFAKGEGVKEPLATDVICGRGKMTASHPANRRFRELVDSHKAAYQNSKRRDEKTRITCELVDKLRAEGRFVLFDPNTKLWYEVSEEYAREKVSHSLRSRSTSTEQRNATNANNSFRILQSAAQQHEHETVVNIAPRTEGPHGNGHQHSPAAEGNSASVASKIGSPSNATNGNTKSKSKPSPGSSKTKAANGALPTRKLPAKSAVHTTPRSKHPKLKPGLDDVVRCLIKDQQALLRAMIQKETERFTSAAAMGPPPRPMPLSFKAEASAVSTLTESLPKMGTVPVVPARPTVASPAPAQPPAASVIASTESSTSNDLMETGFAAAGGASKSTSPKETPSSLTTIATVPAICWHSEIAREKKPLPNKATRCT